MSKRTFPLRDAVANYTPYSPGLSIDEIRERYGLENVIKLASNENPLGTSPLVLKRLASAARSAFRYAQSGNPRLAAALATQLGVGPEHIVTGNGSDEIIDLLIRTVPTPGRHNIVAADPCFSIYRLQSRLCDVEFRKVPLNPDFSYNWQAMRAAVDENTALVFLTTPDNPSGHCPTRAELVAFLQSLPSACLLVADEAYVDFCEENSPFGSILPEFSRFSNLVVMRTFSKSAGLAGLRLGYGVMPVALAEVLRAVKLPFSVNILAEEAGLAVLNDTDFLEKTLETVRLGRKFLARELALLGCVVFPSQANFLMFTPPAGALSATEIFQALLSKGVIIRPLASYGMPGNLRVSMGTAKENAFFIDRLREILAHA